ncbi:MAG: PAS domain S-box protein [Guyparkeria sp.]
MPTPEDRIRQLEAALEAERARADDLYQEMFVRNAAPKLLIAADSGQIMDANPAAISFYGYGRDTLLSLKIDDINAATSEEVAEERGRAKREERRYFRFRHRLANGELRHVEVYTGPMTVDGVECLHSIIHDVTEARRYQQRLEYYRDIFESLPVGVYENRPGEEGHFSAVNPAMVRLFEADSREQLLATPTARLYRDPTGRKAFSDRLLEAGQLHDEVLRLQTLEGNPIVVSVTATVRRLESGEEAFGGVMMDITEQQRMRQHLQESELRQRHILEAMAEGVVLHNRDGEIVEANPAARRILGLDDPALLGRRSEDPAWQAIHTDGSPFPGDRHPAMVSLRDGVSVREEEMGLPQPDGGIRWLRVNSEPLFIDGEERPHKVVATFVDVTERYEARRHLAESEARYRDLVENQPQLIQRYLPDTAITFVNSVLADLLGASAEDLVGERWIESIEPEARGEFFATLARLTPEQPVNRNENALVDASGHRRWIHWTNRAFFNGEGAAVEFQSVGVDITERRELEEEQERLTAIIEAMPDLVSMAGIDGRPFYFNKAGRSLLGLAPTQAPDVTLIRERHPNWAWSIVENVALPTARAQGVWRGETAFLTLDGEEIPVLQTVIAHHDHNGEMSHYSTIMRDLSEEKAREFRLRELTAIMEATPDFISLACPQGKVLYVNRGGRRLLGLPENSREAVEGEMLPDSQIEAGDWAHPEWASTLIREQGIPRAMRDGQWEGETALLTADREELPVSQVILAHRDDDGRLLRLSTIMRDISRHKALERALECRQSTLAQLLSITASGADLDSRLDRLLELGATFFKLPFGIISRVWGNDYRVLNAVSPGDVIKPGARFDLQETYCVHALAADRPTGFHQAGESSLRRHPCHEKQGLGAYLGAPIHVGDRVYGTLNFSRFESREPFSPYDWQLIMLMAQWVSYELTQEANRRALEVERNRFVGGPTVVLAWRREPGSPITYVSPNIHSAFGHAQAELIGQPYLDLIHPADRRQCSEQIEFLERSEVDQIEREYRLRDGTEGYRWVHDFVVAERDKDGNVESLSGYLLDITRRRELESERRLLAVAFQTGQALMLLSPDWRIERVNDAFTRLTGYRAEEVVGRDPGLLDSAENDADRADRLAESLSRQGYWEGEVYRCGKGGQELPLWESVRAVTDAGGAIEHYVSVFHDISEQKRVERELQHLATHDRLTGAYNRGKLYELLEAAEVARQRYDTPFSVVMFDIDHFKVINDTHGHQVGDRVLIELSRRVDGLCRLTDQFGRWGGEEFLVIATHTTLKGALKLAERIRAALADTPFPDVGTLTVSVGVAQMRDGLTTKELEGLADAALYAAKDAGRNRVRASGG